MIQNLETTYTRVTGEKRKKQGKKEFFLSVNIRVKNILEAGIEYFNRKIQYYR
jgi:hypothetical protein